MTMEPVEVRRGHDGVPVLGEGPPVVGFSLALLYDGTADPRWLTIEDGHIVLRGVDADGGPVVLRYRPVDFQPAAGDKALAVNEGGFLVCQRVT